MGGERKERLKDLYERIRRDSDYRNERMGEVLVPGMGPVEGNPAVLVGEAPGREEETRGSPFVGPAGRNLNKLLEHIDLSRERVFITNLIKYRPIASNGRNRSPSPIECRRALPYLIEELAILSPRLVVCLGLSAAKILLDDPGMRMSEANGVCFQKQGLTIMVTYHPSPLNYVVSEKREALFNAFERIKGIVGR
jgi:uracil-DNA glycosylase family 4